MMTSQSAGRRDLALLALVIFSALGAGRSPGQQTPPARTLAVGGRDVMTLDFLAVAADGRPVPDLKAEDLTFRIDGTVRPIRALQLVNVTDGAPAAASGPADPLPPPFGANSVARPLGRSVYIVIDNETMRPGGERSTKEAIAQFLSRLSPRDQVALITVPHGGAQVDLTSDLSRVRRGVTQLAGTGPASETPDEAACHARSTVEALSGILDALASASTPSEVVFVATYLAGPRSAITISRGRGYANNIGGCELLPETFKNVGQAAAAARAHLYVVQVDTSTLQNPTSTSNNTRGNDNLVQGLDDIAGVTGGPRFSLGGAGEGAFARIARETSAYYVASFDVDPAERQRGGSHQVSLKAARNDVTLRVRPDMVFNAGSAAGMARPTATTPPDMMKTATVFGDLSVRVAGFASRDTGSGALKIIAVAETADPLVHLSAASAGLYNDKGTLISQSSFDAAELTTTPMVAVFVAPPGTYRLRFAATDVSGHAGTADYQVGAVLTAAGSLKLSALVLGIAKNGFTPQLQFGAGTDAVAYFELYGGATNMQVSAVVELATSVNGPAIASVTPTALGTVEKDRFIFTAVLPLGTLPPGDYIVRAIVGAEGQPEGRVMHTLRKAGQ